MSDEREQRIRQRAHAIWEAEGHPHGSDRSHWDQAVREIDAEEAAQKKPARAAGKASAKAAADKPVKAPAAKKPGKAKPA